MRKSALIIKLAAIGDIVMALPMIEALHRQNPEVRISWVCGRTVAPLLEKLNLIDEIIVIDDQKLLAGSLLCRLWELTKIWIRLFGRRFDLVVTGHADSRYRLLSLTTLASQRTSFQHGNKHSHPVPGRHHSDEYVRLIDEGQRSDHQKVKLPAVDWELSSEIQKYLPAEKTTALVALAVGGAKNVLHEDAIRRWPLERYVSLAGKLIDNQVAVILTGGPGDEWIITSFADLKVIDLVGKTSLVELVALYRKCDAVITHDSGPMHLAGLAGAPLVALFGPTNPYEKVPRNGLHEILWGGEDLACRPCYDGKGYDNCQDNLCMKQISVVEVFNAINSVSIGGPSVNRN